MFAHSGALIALRSHKDNANGAIKLSVTSKSIMAIPSALFGSSLIILGVSYLINRATVAPSDLFD